MKKLLLIRHAERPVIAPNEVGNEVLLTRQGELDATAFGNALPASVVSIKSSPIERCVQTARLMASGANYPIDEICFSHDLGDPGFIISDGGQAWKHWQTKGHQAVNEHLLSGQEHWSGFADLSASTQTFATRIKEELQRSRPGIHIWVTHDTVLATFASRVLPKRLTLKQWPNFLGYLDISLEDGELSYRYSR